MLDYGTLKFIWWIFIGVLLTGFLITGGMDLGVGILLPFLGKTDNDRRFLLNAIGPTWEGNQVWLITFIGALFAAWPLFYAVAFSGLYIVMVFMLCTLILRPPGMDFRSKMPSHAWRKCWDGCLFVSSFFPVLFAGIALGNVFLGLPFHYNDILQPHYTGNVFDLFHPFSMLTAVLMVGICVFHASVFLRLKLPSHYFQKIQTFVLITGSIVAITFICWLGWIGFSSMGYKVINMPDIHSAFNPTVKKVIFSSGAWFTNYMRYPVLWALPSITVLSIFCTLFLCKKGLRFTMLSSSVGLIGIVSTIWTILFPFILPSSTHPNHSLTLWDATSSPLTLTWMFVVTILLLPIILLYTSWVFKVVNGPVSELHY